MAKTDNINQYRAGVKIFVYTRANISERTVRKELQRE